MTGNATREEFSRLEGRVEVLEGDVEGEKMVTRHVLEQSRRNGDDLAAIKSRLDRVERKVEDLGSRIDSLGSKVESLGAKVGDLDGKVGDLDGKVGNLGANLNGMTKSLPTIIAQAMRDVLRERDQKA